MDKKGFFASKAVCRNLYKTRERMHIYSVFMHSERQNNVILCIFPFILFGYLQNIL